VKRGVWSRSLCLLRHARTHISSHTALLKATAMQRGILVGRRIAQEIARAGTRWHAPPSVGGRQLLYQRRCALLRARPSEQVRVSIASERGGHPNGQLASCPPMGKNKAEAAGVRAKRICRARGSVRAWRITLAASVWAVIGERLCASNIWGGKKTEGREDLHRRVCVQRRLITQRYDTVSVSNALVTPGSVLVTSAM